MMQPFQTKAVSLVLVAVALGLASATLASAANTPFRGVAATATNEEVPATRPNGNSAVVPQVVADADDDDGLTSGDDPVGTDSTDDDDDTDSSDDGDL
jgi:hypothetical protein